MYCLLSSVPPPPLNYHVFSGGNLSLSKGWFLIVESIALWNSIYSKILLCYDSVNIVLELHKKENML